MDQSCCNDPENIIQEVFELRLPVKAILDNGIELEGCRLFCEAQNTREILIQTERRGCPEKGKIGLSWTHLSALYSCTVALIAREEIDLKTRLRVLFPDKIIKEERRKYFRVKPSESKPVLVRFALADKRVVNIEAADICGGGIALVVPRDLSRFKAGDALFLNIALPALGEINSAAAIKDVSYLLNMARIGMEFAHMPEETQRIVMRYVMAREPEMREEARRIRPSDKPTVCCVEEKGALWRCEFLAEKFDVARINFFNAFSRLAAGPPDLIIMNDVPEKARTLMGIIRQHKALKGVPVILLSGKEQEENADQENLFILHVPVSEKLLMKTSGDLIEKYRLSRYIEKRRLTVISGQGKKILIIDRSSSVTAKSIESLTNCGFEVGVDRSEENILDKIEKKCPDIILLDEETDKIDPVSLCRLININKTIRAIPKVILTSDARNFEKFYSQGYFAGFLAKPINTEQLMSKMLELAVHGNGRE